MFLVVVNSGDPVADFATSRQPAPSKAPWSCVEEVPGLTDRGSGHPVACHYAESLALL
ncbi:hypothetical protein [Streptomyces sp. NPDC001348]